MFNECVTLAEAIEYALSRSMSVEISPMWRSFDPPKDRRSVEITLLDEDGKEVAMTFVPIP